MAQNGLGGIAIASELKERKIVAPSVYKYQRGDTRFSRYPAIANDDIYVWCPATIRQILCDPVYTGQLISLKTECVDCKTKRTIYVPQDQHIVTMDAHEAIISQEIFETVQEIRTQHNCAANTKRFNLFRGKLYCECCGHPLAIQRDDAVASCYLYFGVSFCYVEAACNRPMPPGGESHSGLFVG